MRMSQLECKKTDQSEQSSTQFLHDHDGILQTILKIRTIHDEEREQRRLSAVLHT